jgi:hypothetical protein
LVAVHFPLIVKALVYVPALRSKTVLTSSAPNVFYAANKLFLMSKANPKRNTLPVPETERVFVYAVVDPAVAGVKSLIALKLTARMCL